jgi:heat shock protein HtpX
VYEQIARNKRRTVAYIGLFVLTWLAVGAAVGWIAAVVNTTPGAGTAVRADVLTGVVIACVLALLAVAGVLVSGDRLVLAVAGARPADPVREAALCDLVAALAIGEGIPAPAVYVVDDPSPNAFATGIRPERASVTVTTGLLATMDREELEGVLGHEFSHIKNYDTRLLLVVATLIGAAGLLASLSWRSAFFARMGRGRDSGQLGLVLLAAGLLLAVVAFVVGPLIRLALSRRREFLADAGSVELTRNPTGLIRALRALEANDRPLRRANHATAAMCIDDPLQHHAGTMHRLFDTHPPIGERIAVLERMAAGLSA